MADPVVSLPARGLRLLLPRLVAAAHPQIHFPCTALTSFGAICARRP